MQLSCSPALLPSPRTGLYAGELPAELKNVTCALPSLFLSRKPQPTNQQDQLSESTRNSRCQDGIKAVRMKRSEYTYCYFLSSTALTALSAAISRPVRPQEAKHLSCFRICLCPCFIVYTRYVCSGMRFVEPLVFAFLRVFARYILTILPIYVTSPRPSVGHSLFPRLHGFVCLSLWFFPLSNFFPPSFTQSSRHASTSFPTQPL